MRNLITFLILLSSLVTFSQNNKLKKSNSGGVNENSRIVREFVPPIPKNVSSEKVQPDFDKKLVFIEIAHLLDSIREYMYDQELLETKIDINGSKGAEHHCNFLKNFITKKDFNRTFLGHGELKEYGDFKYDGKDTVIFDWAKRMRYFAKDSMDFLGEVCSGGDLIFISYEGLTAKEIAKNIIYDFYDSKEHWEILTYSSYTEIALDLQIKQLPNHHYVYWFTMAVGYDVNITKKSFKSKFYYPGNQLGLTEYYEEVYKVSKINKIKKPTLQ